ncbi:MAG: hypothetical protein GXP31_07240 [Kiritimatiellaeota bacterium]|nr:hypothetical protein [Kiritimatiellota bacterium]
MSRTFLLAALLASVFSNRLLAATVRTQTLQLQPGWNSVFIEVEPTDVDPSAVFAGAPVEIVTTYFPNTSPVEFIRDPDEKPWTDSGWSTWYAPSRSDAFLSKLHAIQANRPYLIKLNAACTLSITGEVKFNPIFWQPNSLNFVGFHVDAASPPTFEQFFSGAEALEGQRIYELVNGHWKLVTNVSGEDIVAGRAYWVYCAKGSAFQGPFTVAIPYGDTLDFGSQATVQTLTMTNTGTEPMGVTLADLGRTLPMAYRVYNPDAGETTYTDLPASLDVGTIEAGQTYTFTLLVRREDFTRGEQSTVLKITTDNGICLWIAVKAKRLDLE